MKKSPARPFEALASLAVAVVFFLGLYLVPAQEVMPLYVVGILLAMWSEWPKLGYLLAALSTFGILITASQDPNLWSWPHIFGEVVAAGACWAAAFVVVRYRRGGMALAAAQQALGRSLRELEHMKYALDQSAIVAMTDVTGTITYVNDKFCEISQYSREELIGRNHRLLNSGYHSLEFFKSMYRTIVSGPGLARRDPEPRQGRVACTGWTRRSCRRWTIAGARSSTSRSGTTSRSARKVGGHAARADGARAARQDGGDRGARSPQSAGRHPRRDAGDRPGACRPAVRSRAWRTKPSRASTR